MFGFRGRYEEAVLGIPQRLRGQCLLQQLIQVRAVVAVTKETPEEPPAPGALTWREHPMPFVQVQVQQEPGCEAGSQSEGDDPARGSARDKVKIVPDMTADQTLIFQLGEDARGENPLDSTAVNRQDLERRPFGPRQRLTPGLQDRVRPTDRFLAD